MNAIRPIKAPILSVPAAPAASPFSPVRRVSRTAWCQGESASGSRAIPEEVAVALTYNRFSYAVMMASPSDLEDFAVGFSLSERVVETEDEIRELEVVTSDAGIELRMWIDAARAEAFTERRRYLAGPTGCGLCGVETLAEAMRPPPHVGGTLRISAEVIAAAVAAMPQLQVLNHQTRAIHAASFWEPDAGIVALREDVGRHNALDKLAGALARSRRSASRGAVLLTSRVSVEMIQKTAVLGAPIVVAVSAPTALAVRLAESAGITLVAIARDDGFEIFTHPDRIIVSEPAEHVA
jgi:FdhD protein